MLYTVRFKRQIKDYDQIIKLHRQDLPQDDDDTDEEMGDSESKEEFDFWKNRSYEKTIYFIPNNARKIIDAIPKINTSKSTLVERIDFIGSTIENIKYLHKVYIYYMQKYEVSKYYVPKSGGVIFVYVHKEFGTKNKLLNSIFDLILILEKMLEPIIFNVKTIRI